MPVCSIVVLQETRNTKTQQYSTTHSKFLGPLVETKSGIPGWFLRQNRPYVYNYVREGPVTSNSTSENPFFLTLHHAFGFSNTGTPSYIFLHVNDG